MARSPILIDERNKRIQQRFETLRDERDQGARKFTPEYCVLRIAQEFYLSPRTVERIVYTA